jgi:hypothetical protein
MKGMLGFVILVLVIIGFLLLSPGKEYPPLPADKIHAGVAESSCMDCHGPGKSDALKKSHPPKFECDKCHKRKT